MIQNYLNCFMLTQKKMKNILHNEGFRFEH